MSSSRDDLKEFPGQVRDAFGFALYQAQGGERPVGAKALKGLGSGVVELVSDFAGDTYRAVYTVRFEKAVYVLHAFKKKAKHGIKTPQSEIALVRRRLKAETHYLKAQLVSEIVRAARARKLTQTGLGKVIGVSQPEVSRMFHGHFREYSVERLMHFLTVLDREI